ncbi:hypothetical protein FRB94_013620 [Tulasnella sp. JGI-2019a]|nr:hypothetical protein FRB94_013620 [Tulasnella sp. JGI-2019a]
MEPPAGPLGQPPALPMAAAIELVSVYIRSRQITTMLAVYTPAYTLFFKNFALTPADLAVLQAISQVQGAFDAMIPDRYKDDLWVLNRCYVAMTPTYFGMVLSAALIYEIWNFLRRDSTAHSTGILLAGCSTASAYSLLSYQPSSRASAVP